MLVVCTFRTDGLYANVIMYTNVHNYVNQIALPFCRYNFVLLFVEQISQLINCTTFGTSLIRWGYTYVDH